jgi:hypothetical protein
LGKLLSGFFLGLLVACSAITAKDTVLSFKDREFIVHPDKPAMSFPYFKKVCVPRSGVGRILGDKCHQERVEDNYDMNDKAVREKFIAADCTMTCAGRFQ